MSLKKETNTALFGMKIKKEPFLIDTETPLQKERQIKNKKNEPDVLLKTTNKTSVGKTFNKILPEIEDMLKIIHDNRHSKINLDISLKAIENKTGFNNVKQETNIYEEVNKLKQKQGMSLKFKPK